MSKPKRKTAATSMADLGLTPGEAEILAKGARHLFGTANPEPDEDEAPAEKPKAKAPANSLAGVTLGGGAHAGSKQHAAKKGSLA